MTLHLFWMLLEIKYNHVMDMFISLTNMVFAAILILYLHSSEFDGIRSHLTFGLDEMRYQGSSSIKVLSALYAINGPALYFTSDNGGFLLKIPNVILF